MSKQTKQTAVKWLVKHLCERGYIHAPSFGHSIIDKAIEQAKAMEKEQIVNSCYSWYSKLGNTNNVIVYKLPEEYYNETYGDNK